MALDFQHVLFPSMGRFVPGAFSFGGVLIRRRPNGLEVLVIAVLYVCRQLPLQSCKQLRGLIKKPRRCAQIPVDIRPTCLCSIDIIDQSTARFSGRRTRGSELQRQRVQLLTSTPPSQTHLVSLQETAPSLSTWTLPPTKGDLRPFLPFPSFPPLLIRLDELRSAESYPSGPGKVQPPNALLAHSRSK